MQQITYIFQYDQDRGWIEVPISELFANDIDEKKASALNSSDGNDDSLEISINMDFDYKMKSCSTLFERHSNGMMVLKMVDVSLLHITPGDVELLETQAGRHSEGCLVVYPKDRGYFVLVDDDDVYEKALRSAGFSDSFMTLFMMASEIGAAWIELDADGTECPSLPKFQHA